MKTEGGDLSCKPENYLNVHERVEMIERNEDGPLNLFIAQRIMSVCKRKHRQKANVVCILLRFTFEIIVQ